LPRTMAGAPLFVQFSVIDCWTLGQASAAPALCPRKRGLADSQRRLPLSRSDRPA
jgi:hypothetical protein